jgi:hypothetical protein
MHAIEDQEYYHCTVHDGKDNMKKSSSYTDASCSTICADMKQETSAKS